MSATCTRDISLSDTCIRYIPLKRLAKELVDLLVVRFKCRRVTRSMGANKENLDGTLRSGLRLELALHTG